MGLGPGLPEDTVTNERCTDDDLRAVVASNPDPRARSAAEELLAIRGERRRDSRRAEQVKRLRWVQENALTKLEALTKRWETEGLMQASEPDDETPR